VTAPRAVIFDFNGTISHDEPLLAELFERIFGEVGIAVPASLYFEEFAGYSDPEIVDRVLARFRPGAGPGLARRLVERRTALYLEAVAGRSTVASETAELVRRVAERRPVAIASGAARKEIETVLEGAGLRGVFEVIVSCEDVTRGKPDPEGYLLAVRRLGATLPDPIEPGQVLAVEDSPLGVAAARAAGLRCVAVAGTSQPESLGEAEAVLARLDWSIPVVRGFFG
jgi:beta-phosphoglucomutase